MAPAARRAAQVVGAVSFAGADAETLALAGLFGLAAGSFINVVVHRLPAMLDARDAGESAPASLLYPPSHCPACSQPLRLRDNIPLVSYVLLRGRCAFCAARISPRYFIVELLAALLAAGVVAHFGVGLKAAAALALVWTLLCLSFIDLRTHTLPDELTLGLLWLGLLASLGGLFADPYAAVAGAAAGYLALWLVHRVFLWLTGREGLGYGDMKLLAAGGAWFGWQALPAILLAASLAGLAVSVCLIAAGRLRRDAQVPFGPYLALGMWAFLHFGEALSSAIGGALGAALGPGAGPGTGELPGAP